MKKRTKSPKDLPKNISIIPVNRVCDSLSAQLLGISIANYLTGVEHKTVTLINTGDTNIFENLAWYHDMAFVPDEGYFKLHNVIYYPHYNEKYLSGNTTDCTIFIGKTAYERTQLKLVTGSLNSLTLKNYADFLKRMVNLYSKSNDTCCWRFLAHYISEKDKKFLEKKFNVSIRRIPDDLNPFKLKRSELAFFADILSLKGL